MSAATISERGAVTPSISGSGGVAPSLSGRGAVTPRLDRDDPLGAFEWAMGLLGMAAFAIGIALTALLVDGCHSGIKIAIKDSSSVNLGSISLEDSTWPIVSYFTGPTFTYWTRDGLDGSLFVTGSAVMTNTTSALGIYQSSENKAIDFAVGYTNLNSSSCQPSTP